MNNLDIYRIISGEPVIITSIASDNATLANAIMGKNEVSVSLVTDYIPDIKVGDYIVVNGIKYRLNREPEFIDKSIQHDTIFVFEAPEYTLIDKILTNKITGSTKVTLLGKLRDWIELVVWNINKTDENQLGIDIGWQVGTIPDTDYMTLSFDGMDCRSLLSELASAYNYEYYVNNRTINYVSRIENERGLTFTQGRGNGLYEIEQSNVDSGDITTRVYPVGGTDNIIPGEGDEEGRLILPEKYLEIFTEANRVVEKKVVFEGIHPTFTGKVENPTGENKREFVCSTIDFNISDLAVADEARINFLTGDLMGKSFEFKWKNEEKKITLIYQEDDLAAIDPETQTRPTIPSELKFLRGGEEFNFTGIRLGDAYKNAAVAKLREKATDWLKFHSQKRIKFTLSVDYRYMRDKGDLNPGDLITVKIPERGLSKLIRVTATEKNLKTGSITCVVSNYLTEKWEDKIEGQISSMQATINGSGNGGSMAVLEKFDERTPSDKNVFSSLRSLWEILKNNEKLKELFLSRLEKDEAAGHINFKKGTTVENGLIVRLPKQNTDAALASCLLEEDIDTIVEEDEDGIIEVPPAETSDLTLGGLMNVVPEADAVDEQEDYVLVKLKGESDWTLLPASSIGGGGSGVQRNVLVQNDLDSRNLSASKGEPCNLKFTFVSQERYGIGGDYEDTGERGLCQISIKNAVNAEFTVVKQMYIQSGYTNTIDVAEFLTSGSNQIMIKVTGEITELTTSSFVYTVQLTSLSIAADNFRWWTAFTAENVTIPLNIGGNVAKILYVTVSGKNYNKSYNVALGTTVYTETAYNYQLTHPGRTGVYNVSMYVANTDGSIRTRTISFNIICAVAGEAVKLIAINNVIEKATNWSENTLFDYAMYDGSNATTSAQFTVKKDGSHVYSSFNDRISTSTKHSFSLPLEVETIDNSDFSIVVSVTDGGSELASAMTIPVNNSLGFSSVAGAVFYMNPRTRSNNQSNYKSIVNEMTGEVIPATWSGMNWGNDGWTTDADANNVLRVMASSRVDIGYKVFAKESARLGKTVEIDYKVDNVTDFNDPVIKMSTDSDSFVGLRVYPDNVVMYTNSLKTTDNQSINLFEGRRLRLTLVIMPDAYGNPDFNLCIVYVNGVKNREFTYKNNDYFAHNADIIIGSDRADVDIYGIRVYDSALTSEAVLRNLINWQVDNTEKTRIQEKNDVMDANGSEIDFENVRDQFNVMVFDNTFPSLANPNKMKGILEVFFADHPEWNVTISNIEAKGQGTSSMRYWRWNIRFTLDKKLSIVSAYDGSTTTGGWAMVPTLPKATKITAKKNFASSMHSHKIGSVNSVDELYRAMGYLNEAMKTEKYKNARVAVYQLPFVAFEKSINDEGKAVYTFKGLYTMGPDKGDKNTFGHDTDLFPGLISIEGADNSPLCALFRVPWSSRMQYNEEEEAFQYNGANSWDFGAGETTNINTWIPAYNIAYQCSNRLKPFNGTLAELNAQVATYRNEPYEFWIAKAGDANLYNVYYYEASEGRFIASDIGNGTINLKMQLSAYLAADLSPFTADQLNEMFINARVQKFRAEAPQYWDIDDAILHRNWVEFHAGTDNRAKNTYPYCFGNAGSKWKWRYDDLDTIFDTDNQGQAKKGYYVEFHDTYDTGGSVWNGETSNFWNLLDLAFPDEVWAGMRKMMTAMEELSGVKSGTDFDKLYAYFQKYYFAQAQEYFPQNLYNADAKYTYEESKLAYDKGLYTNDTDPITQSMGDHYAAEQRWITKRIIYMMSKYSFGLFSADGTDNITVRAAGNTIQYELTPAMDLYPAIANGTSIIRGARTKAGEVCRMLIELSGSGDQQNTIQGASYLQDIGDWHDKNVTGSMIIQGRMLREIRLGHATDKIIISITSLTISNCVSLQKLVLTRISTLTGTLSLLACTHLQEVYAGGTSLTQLVLPKGGGLKVIEYSEFNQYITLQNYPLLKTEGVLMDYCKEKVTDFLIENCPRLEPMRLLSTIIEAQQSQGANHVLKHIRAVGFEEEYYSADALDMLANLADGSYEGLSAEGIAGEEPIPVLDGKITVHSKYYQDSVDKLRRVFNRLELIVDGVACIKISDPEVKRILVEQLDRDGNGEVNEDESINVDLRAGWFQNNQNIRTFREMKYFKGLSTTHNYVFKGSSIEDIEFSEGQTLRGGAFYDCTKLRRIVLPPDMTELNWLSNNPALEECDLPETLVSLGADCFASSQMEEVVIPPHVSSVGGGFCRYCQKLKRVVFKTNLITTFNGHFLEDCPNLEVLVMYTETPPATGWGSFWNTNSTMKIYVPDACVSAYKAASGWKDRANYIYPISSYSGTL